MASAAERAFSIIEIVEMILFNLQDGVKAHPNTQLFVLQRVNKTFQAAIEISKALRRQMWLEFSNCEVADIHRMQPVVWLGDRGLVTLAYGANDEHRDGDDEDSKDENSDAEGNETENDEDEGSEHGGSEDEISEGHGEDDDDEMKEEKEDKRRQADDRRCHRHPGYRVKLHEVQIVGKVWGSEPAQLSLANWANLEHAAFFDEANEASWRKMKPVLFNPDDQAYVTCSTTFYEDYGHARLATDERVAIDIYLQATSPGVTIGAVYETFESIRHKDHNEQAVGKKKKASPAYKAPALTCRDTQWEHEKLHDAGQCLKRTWLCSSCLGEACLSGKCGGPKCCAWCTNGGDSEPVYLQ